MTTETFKDEVQAMRPMLLGVARGILGNDEEAEDVVQDALLRLWQLRDEPIRNVYGFARIVVRNLCLSKVRRKQVTVLRLRHMQDMTMSWSSIRTNGGLAPSSEDYEII